MKASHIRENILTESEMKSRGFAVDKHTYYHGFGKELFLDVIRNLDDVTLAYRGTKNAEKSERRQNYFLIIFQHSSDKGTINVPVDINEHGLYNRVEIDTNKIGTVFGRDNLKSFLEQEVRKGNLVRIRKRSSPVSVLTADKVTVSNNEATSRGGSEVSEKPTTKADNYYDITPEEFADYKKALRSYRLIPNLQDVAELEDVFGTFGAAYRQYGRKLNMRAQGTPGALHIDEVWEELCDSVPLLNRDAESTQDMWRNLIEVRDSLDEKNGFNPYITDGDLTANEAAGALGADILERFNEVRADTTFADRAQQRIDLRFPIVVMRVKIFSLTGCSDIINPSLNRTLSRNPLTARPTAHTLVPHDIKQCKQVYRQQCMMHKIVFVCKRCGLKAHSGRTRSHL